LKKVCLDFLKSIKHQTAYRADARAGLRVVTYASRIVSAMMEVPSE